MSTNALLPVLLAVPTVMLACQAGGLAVRRLGQPPVVGEILVGILLGPSLLGWLAPTLQHQLLPTAIVLVVMAVVTTAATAPPLTRLTRNGPRLLPQRRLQVLAPPAFPAGIAREAAE